MVTLSAKKEAAVTLQKKYQISERHACRVLSLPISSKRYQPKKVDDPRLIERIKYWAEKRPSYGCPIIHEKILRDGFKVNHKRTERLYYKVLKLSLRMKPKRKKFRSVVRVPIELPLRPNHIWSMDFVSDQLGYGKRIRGLVVVDVLSKMNMALDFDYTMSGFRVVQVLERVCEFNGKPEYIRVDNGPEFICMALDKWAYENGVKLQFSRPGKPTDNAFVESFNGKMRKEFLNRHWFKDLNDVNEKAQTWREEYNTDRPHRSLGMKTPMEFVENWELNSTERLIS